MTLSVREVLNKLGSRGYVATALGDRVYVGYLDKRGFTRFLPRLGLIGPDENVTLHTYVATLRIKPTAIVVEMVAPYPVEVGKLMDLLIPLVDNGKIDCILVEKPGANTPGTLFTMRGFVDDGALYTYCKDDKRKALDASGTRCEA